MIGGVGKKFVREWVGGCVDGLLDEILDGGRGEMIINHSQLPSRDEGLVILYIVCI